MSTLKFTKPKLTRLKNAAKAETGASKVKTFPIGIDYGPNDVRIAWISKNGTFSVVETPILEGNAAKTVRAILAREGIATKEAVFGVRANEATLAVAKFPGVKSRGELEKAARMILHGSLGADIEKFDVRALPASNGNVVYGAIRKELIATYQQFAKSAGLKPIAIDHEAFVWKRLVSGVDGVIAAGESDASICLFEGDTVRVQSFAKSEWIPQLIEFVRDLRSKRESEARVFHSVGKLEDQIELQAFVEQTNSTVSPLEVNDPLTNEKVASPSWLFAYGLATYGLSA
jgi:hypothetical protein